MATTLTATAVSAAAQATMNQSRNKMGVVIAAGVLNRTAKVRIAKSVWNRKIQRTLIQHIDHFVHDPSNTARTGDIVTIESGFRVSREKRHRLSAVISPKGPPLSERPPIPSRAELLLEYKKARVASDRRLLAHADAVIRLHELSADQHLVQEVKKGGDEAGVMSSEAQELRDLQGRKDAKELMPRAINGVMMRLKEALKARWREERASMTSRTAELLANELEKEAQKWFSRGIFWLTDGLRPSNKGRTKEWRAEMNWRGEFALEISSALRSRATEALAYKERVDIFAAAVSISPAEAENKMAKAEIDVVVSMAKWLKHVRGVYDTEIQALKEEGGWLKTYAHLKKDSWRWEAHQIQLSERGALDTIEIVKELRAKGSRSLVWYRALQEALEFVPRADVKQFVDPLRAGLLARSRMLEATKKREQWIALTKKAMQEEMKRTNDFARTTAELAGVTSRDPIVRADDPDVQTMEPTEQEGSETLSEDKKISTQG